MVKKANETNNEELLELAVRSAEQGNKDGARVMFRQVLSRDKRNERAMLWLAKIADSPDEREKWLTQVLKVNPNNQTAKKGLKKLSYKTASRENRTLLIWGVIVVVLLVIAIAVVLLVLSQR